MKGRAGALVVGLAGPQLLEAERAWLAHHRPLGVILFSRNVIDLNQLRRLCSDLHALVPGLEISADHEGGAVSQLAAALGRPPAAWALGCLDDVALTERVHRETGLRLCAAGVDRILGPVADVLTEGSNPVIGARAFGRDPALVGRHVAAAVRGYRSAGLSVCLKHWPGHGAARCDTHDRGAGAAPQDGEEALTPFLAGMAEGADAVMVGHLPTGTATDAIATLDGPFLQRSRKRLGGTLRFFADDVTMGALREPMRALGIPAPDDRGEGLVDPADLPAGWLDALVDAGCDGLLCRGVPWSALPAPAHDGQRREPDPGPGREASWDGLPPAPSYETARRLLAGGFPPDLDDPCERWIWMDPDPQDRWWGAAGDPQAARKFFAEAAARGRPGLTPHPSPLDGPRCGRLLVTSFRPWRPAGDALALLQNRLAPRGIALVMGHPQLASGLKETLPESWVICSLFDICADDLQFVGRP
ncbi:hypothetical protein KJ682_15180 [bacterium]|nr:hypothetical protein [bacterium]